MRDRKLILLIIIALIIFGAAIFFANFSGGSNWLWDVSQGGTMLMPLLIVAALVDSINPCAFSILIVSIIFFFGIKQHHSKILAYGLAYILGIFVVYFLIGLGLLQALHIFGVPHFMSKIAAVLLVLFGIINILEALFPKFPLRFAIPHRFHGKMNELLKLTSLPAMFLLGVIVGLCEFPCTGGPYLAVLGLLHDMNTYWRGAGYLVLYNLIFVAPLVVILLLAGNRTLVEKVQSFHKSHKSYTKIVVGLLVIILAFVILSL